MRRYLLLDFHLRVATALSAWPRGDVLFGQLCRAHVALRGSEAMAETVAAYRQGDPWCVVADARPQGFVPRPRLPAPLLRGKGPGARRAASGDKSLGDRAWLEERALGRPAADWGGKMRSHAEVAGLFQSRGSASTAAERVWRQLNRLHGGADDEARSAAVVEVAADLPLVVSIILDTRQASAGHLAECLALVGLEGFGARSSAGLGKFEISACETLAPALLQPGQSALTLAPCAPQGLPLDPALCWYRSMVHFGHHGPGVAAPGATHKTPLLLADTGAVLTPRHWPDQAFARPFIGQPLGGAGQISRVLPGTLHQGWAPFIAVPVPGVEQDLAPEVEG